MTDQLKRLAKEINWPLGKVTKTVELLDEGNTIPFIARYRKEVTGEMDEVVLRQLAERLQYLRNLEQRKTDVLHSIDEQGKLTAELVKIEPKAVGVGQYQHDVTPKKLDEALGAVVEDCVNGVGVEVNTASSALLQYVAGLTRSTADGIVKLRNEQGKLINRRQLLKVPRLGPKAFEQCAGFIRIADGDNPLDNTPVHPESYSVAEALLHHLGYDKNDLNTNHIGQIRQQLQTISVKDLARYY